MTIRNTILFIVLFTFSAIAEARVCNSEQQDYFDYYSETAARRIVNEYGGGQDIVVLAKQCSYNKFGRHYKGKVDIYWNGAIMRSNRYNLEGFLTLRRNSKSEFSETYANTSLKEFRQWRNIIIGGVIVLDYIGENAN